MHPGPAHFVRHVTNPWFPLRPGTTLVYEGRSTASRPGRGRRDAPDASHPWRRCTAISDRVFLDGRLVERTIDWYTQDDRGNVWYFGESTAELDAAGKVISREGSWLAGQGRAARDLHAGPAARGRTYQQEFFAGHAEDRFTVTGRTPAVSTPYVTTAHGLRTKEFTPLEPGVFGAKVYVYGIGQVAEQSITGDPEQLALTEVIPPS